jgi:glucose/arabinose dehydrogenase
MSRRILSGACMILLLVVGLTACGGPPVVSPQPSEPPTSLPASDTPTPRPVPATPTAIEPSDTPTAEPSRTVAAMPTAMSPTMSPAPSPTAGVVVSLDSIRLELQPIVGGLAEPVGIANAGDGSGRLFILEKVGRIRIVQDGKLAANSFLDITDRVRSSGSEQGLLGLAFHPDHARNGLFFVDYINRQGNTVVARFKVGTDPARADPASETTVLTIDQPAANHNGGHLAFGPDGYLYVGTGDGGREGDPFHTGQDGQTLLAKMLRLDVDGGQPYAVPRDNPM